MASRILNRSPVDMEQGAAIFLQVRGSRDRGIMDVKKAAADRAREAEPNIKPLTGRSRGSWMRIL
jgi:hypothetical protein